MTPEERKAKELVEKLLYAIAPAWDEEDLNIQNSIFYKDAIACAEILCDEMITQLERIREPEYTTFIISYAPLETQDGYENLHFWQQVKESLRSLK